MLSLIKLLKIKFMNTLKFTCASFLLFVGLNSFAQKFTEGDKTLAFLAGETKFNLKYDYEGMKVGKKDEATYKAEKIAAYNAKQPGKGDRWAEKWVSVRGAIYEPMFEELLGKVLFKANPAASAAKNVADAKYTVVVKLVMLEPGWNIGITKQNPYCDFEVSWVESASGKVMAKAFMNNVPGVVFGGSDWDFDVSNSIKECFAKAGKMTGKPMAKPIKSK